MSIIRWLAARRVPLAWGVISLLLAGGVVLSIVLAGGALRDQKGAAQDRAVAFTRSVLLDTLTLEEIQGPIGVEDYRQLVNVVKVMIPPDEPLARVRIWSTAAALVFSTHPQDQVGTLADSSGLIQAASSGQVVSRVVDPGPPEAGLAGSTEARYETYVPLLPTGQATPVGVAEIDQLYPAIHDPAYRVWRPVQLVLAALLLMALAILVQSLRTSLPGSAAARAASAGSVASPAPRTRDAASSVRSRAREKRRVRLAEERIAQIGSRANEAEQRALDAERRSADAEQRVADAELSAARSEERAEQEEERARRAEERVYELEARVEELENQRRQDVSEHQRVQERLANTQAELSAALQRAGQAEEPARDLEGLVPRTTRASGSKRPRKERRSDASLLPEREPEHEGESTAPRPARIWPRPTEVGEAEAPVPTSAPIQADATEDGLSFRERITRAAAARHRLGSVNAHKER